MGIEQFPPLDQHSFEELHSVEMREAYNAIFLLLIKLTPLIKEHRYQCIVSDDLSGRIPSEIIQRGANLFYKQTAMPEIPMVGIRGSWSFQETIRHNPTKRFRATQTEIDIARLRLNSNQIPKPKKVLLSTEYIETGKTINNIYNQLVRLGLEVDIASMSIKYNPDYFKQQRLLDQHTILLFGTISPNKPKIWGRPELLGNSYQRKGTIPTYQPEIESDINQMAKKFYEMLQRVQ